MEVDRWVRSAAVPAIEVHPEVSFATLAGAHIPHNKKTWAGAALRRALLARDGVVIPDDLALVGEQAAVDDVLDAAVAAWSARRYAAGVARSYPDKPERFSDDHLCAIWGRRTWPLRGQSSADASFTFAARCDGIASCRT
jgi:predicted RNase H-like nuclease